MTTGKRSLEMTGKGRLSPGPSSKSPSTPDSTNLLIISNIVNYPVLGHINLCPPATSLKGNTLIFDALAFSAVEGEFHEGLSGQCNEAKVGFEWDSCFGKRFLHSALRAPVEMTRRRRSRKQPGCRSAGRKGRLAAAAPKYNELIWIGKKDIQDN